MNLVDGEIDLHSLKPVEIRLKLLKFLDRGYAEYWRKVRIVHGVGRGVAKSRVRKILAETDYIESFKSAGWDEGGKGATVATYRRSY